MKKDELRVNDIVTTRGEGRYILCCLNDAMLLVRDDSYASLDYYDKHLKCNLNHSFDITKVRRPSHASNLTQNKWEYAPVIWDREKLKKITLTEIEEKLGYEVEIVEEKYCDETEDCPDCHIIRWCDRESKNSPALWDIPRGDDND